MASLRRSLWNNHGLSLDVKGPPDSMSRFVLVTPQTPGVQNGRRLQVVCPIRHYTGTPGPGEA